MRQPDPAALAAQFAGVSVPPVHLWHPPCLGDLDMRIARDGTWYYQGTPMMRKSMARLFSSLLRREADGHHYLVTPVEKWRIQVDDAPFVLVWAHRDIRDGVPYIQGLTQLGDALRVDAEHPIVVHYADAHANPAPYVRVRDELWALINRAVFWDLAQWAETGVDAQGQAVWGVHSAGNFFALGPVEPT